MKEIQHSFEILLQILELKRNVRQKIRSGDINHKIGTTTISTTTPTISISTTATTTNTATTTTATTTTATTATSTTTATTNTTFTTTITTDTNNTTTASDYYSAVSELSKEAIEAATEENRQLKKKVNILENEQKLTLTELVNYSENHEKTEYDDNSDENSPNFRNLSLNAEETAGEDLFPKWVMALIFAIIAGLGLAVAVTALFLNRSE
ncbi:hypothetical protein HELRODRAFT_172586 [Helobdella robusta]|uniref:Uncharacterized protein n=1 Tax=Helobdella robusta TaxID=6412 RepID=T1F5K0_HELRO|nr:hypothetical protein HELRODRAFT_172586 [Helobdella robusta]ESO04230.1 hypothetical protein HELRODRAFT_172586 [Helobdella robusta]